MKKAAQTSEGSDLAGGDKLENLNESELSIISELTQVLGAIAEEGSETNRHRSDKDAKRAVGLLERRKALREALEKVQKEIVSCGGTPLPQPELLPSPQDLIKVRDRVAEALNNEAELNKLRKENAALKSRLAQRQPTKVRNSEAQRRIKEFEKNNKQLSAELSLMKAQMGRLLVEESNRRVSEEKSKNSPAKIAIKGRGTENIRNVEILKEQLKTARKKLATANRIISELKDRTGKADFLLQTFGEDAVEVVRNIKEWNQLKAALDGARRELARTNGEINRKKDEMGA